MQSDRTNKKINLEEEEFDEGAYMLLMASKMLVTKDVYFSIVKETFDELNHYPADMPYMAIIKLSDNKTLLPMESNYIEDVRQACLKVFKKCMEWHYAHPEVEIRLKSCIDDDDE